MISLKLSMVWGIVSNKMPDRLQGHPWRWLLAHSVVIRLILSASATAVYTF